MKRLFVLILFINILCGCNRNYGEGGAVAFTFDDQWITEWESYRKVFDKYNIKATFFISRPHMLTDEQIEKLKLLNEDGHEIACHGLNHLDINEFNGSLQLWMDKEIIPAKKILEEKGFSINSFAYPYSKYTRQSDSILKYHFNYIRKATWNYNQAKITSYNEIFVGSNNNGVMSAMGIDRNYKISNRDIEKSFLRAKENNEVLILYAHKIDKEGGDYTIDPGYLEEIFKLTRELNIRSLRISDIEEYFSN